MLTLPCISAPVTIAILWQDRLDQKKSSKNNPLHTPEAARVLQIAAIGSSFDSLGGKKSQKNTIKPITQDLELSQNE